MKNSDFYDIVDVEIEKILAKHSEEKTIKDIKENNTRKSYGFLLWFLENNLPNEVGQVEKWSPYIVDGNDDNSCDLIFSNKERDEEVYYIVQAKWFSKSNSTGGNGISNIYKACLTDFTMMIKHEKAESPVNRKFNEMYKKLKKHIESNGKVRFLLVALCITDPDFRIEELNEYVKSPLVETQIFDLVSMKNTYIDHHMRGYVTDNPLEKIDPINGKINIKIKKYGDLIVKQNNTYIFLLEADHISNLYETYGTRLFLKNVRNPLTVAANEKMKNSAVEEPSHFFDYNNGVTAITKMIYPYFPGNDMVTVSGIQIINGAQTVKSIADAYKNATPSQKKKMAKELIISMKMMVVDDPKLEQDIIQYTNTQTSIEPRDYHSNDIIQEKIYYALLRYTDIIYERKRGEFEGVDRKANRIVSNEEMAQAYIAFKLQNPFLARTAPGTIFSSEAEVYGTVFNDEMDYRDLYNAYEVYCYVDEKINTLKSTRKSNLELEETYKYLKDARYYITALIICTYKDVDKAFNKAYQKNDLRRAEKGELPVDKDAMARGFLFGQLSEHKSGALDEAYIEACNAICLYAKSVSGNSIYTKGSYDRILEQYKGIDDTENISTENADAS